MELHDAGISRRANAHFIKLAVHIQQHNTQLGWSINELSGTKARRRSSANVIELFRRTPTELQLGPSIVELYDTRTIRCASAYTIGLFCRI